MAGNSEGSENAAILPRKQLEWVNLPYGARRVFVRYVLFSPPLS